MIEQCPTKEESRKFADKCVVHGQWSSFVDRVLWNSARVATTKNQVVKQFNIQPVATHPTQVCKAQRFVKPFQRFERLGMRIQRFGMRDCGFPVICSWGLSFSVQKPRMVLAKHSMLKNPTNLQGARVISALRDLALVPDHVVWWCKWGGGWCGWWSGGVVWCGGGGGWCMMAWWCGWWWWWRGKRVVVWLLRHFWTPNQTHHQGPENLKVR